MVYVIVVLQKSRRRKYLKEVHERRLREEAQRRNTNEDYPRGVSHCCPFKKIHEGKFRKTT